MLVDVVVVVNGQILVDNFHGVLGILVVFGPFGPVDHDIGNSIPDVNIHILVPFLHLLRQLSVSLFGFISILVGFLLFPGLLILVFFFLGPFADGLCDNQL